MWQIHYLFYVSFNNLRIFAVLIFQNRLCPVVPLCSERQSLDTTLDFWPKKPNKYVNLLMAAICDLSTVSMNWPQNLGQSMYDPSNCAIFVIGNLTDIPFMSSPISGFDVPGPPVFHLEFWHAYFAYCCLE